jgi:hypothetical protein
MIGRLVRYSDDIGTSYPATVITVLGEGDKPSLSLSVVMNGAPIVRSNVPHYSARIKPKEFWTGKVGVDGAREMITLPAREPGEYWAE